MGRYDALFKEGLIAAEVYEDLKGSVEDMQARETRPRFDLGLDTRELIGKLDLFADLSDQQLERVQKLLRPRFAVPRELIVHEGDRGDACYFIASGAAEVVFPGRRIPLGTGDLFGEMALLTGMTRQADVVAMTYCRLLVLRKVDFDRFMQDNRDIRLVIHKIAAVTVVDEPLGRGRRVVLRARAGRMSRTLATARLSFASQDLPRSSLDGTATLA